MWEVGKSTLPTTPRAEQRRAADCLQPTLALRLPAAADAQRWVAQAMRNVTEYEELLDRLCFRRNSEDFCFEQQLNRQI
jgi:hypothetical protein